MKFTAILAAALAIVATEARADIVRFKNGRTMSVKSCQVDADTARMRLRDGGEVTFPSSIIDRVEPDEVPYPEPGAGDGGPGTAIEAVATANDLVRLPDPAFRIPDEVLAARRPRHSVR